MALKSCKWSNILLFFLFFFPPSTLFKSETQFCSPVLQETTDSWCCLHALAEGSAPSGKAHAQGHAVAFGLTCSPAGRRGPAEQRSRSVFALASFPQGWFLVPRPGEGGQQTDSWGFAGYAAGVLLQFFLVALNMQLFFILWPSQLSLFNLLLLYLLLSLLVWIPWLFQEGL